MHEHPNQLIAPPPTAPCQLAHGTAAGLHQITLHNGLVAADILLDKGANLRQFHHLPTATRTLAETHDWPDQLAHFLRNGRRGSTYSDHYEGGWQDVLPARAHWPGGTIDGADGTGEAATLPWKLAHSLSTPTAGSITCHATLPRTGLAVSKKFHLRRGSHTLSIQTTLRNPTTHDVHLAWTQHPALGGDLLDHSSLLWLPPAEPCARRPGTTESNTFPLTLAGWNPTAALLPPPNTPDRFLTLANVATGRAELVSHTRRLGVRLRWDTAAYPHLWLWLARRDSLTCLAPEPSTTYLPESLPHPRPPLLRPLRPGHSLTTSLSLAIFHPPDKPT